MLKKIKVGKKFIGPGEPTYIIAEIGINHEGDPDVCLKMIKEAAAAGADAIKLQTMDPDQNYSKETQSYKLFKKAWLSSEQTKNMFDFSRKANIEPITTVGDFKTLEWVKKLNPNAYKISSGLIDHIPLIKEISSIKKPMIISTGTADFDEIDKAFKTVKESKNHKIILLHCVSSYPTPLEQANLLFINNLKKIYGPLVGYSDHTLGDLAAITSISLGSCVIEKHFTLDKSRNSFDHNISLEPKEFNSMVKKIRIIEKMLNTDTLLKSSTEEENKKWMRRIVVAKDNLKDNKQIKMNDILFIRKPFSKKNISASATKKIIGKKIKKAVKIFQPILWRNLN